MSHSKSCLHSRPLALCALCSAPFRALVEHLLSAKGGLAGAGAVIVLPLAFADGDALDLQKLQELQERLSLVEVLEAATAQRYCLLLLHVLLYHLKAFNRIPKDQIHILEKVPISIANDAYAVWSLLRNLLL